MGRFTIIIVVGFAIIAAGLKLTQGRLIRRAQELSSERLTEMKARNVTTSAVNMCLYHIGQNFDWRDGYDDLNIGGGTADAVIADASDDPGLPLNQVRITATGSYGGETATAVVVMRKSAYSEFAYFTDVEPLIYFITGDTIRGPIHTNGQFHISGNPVFYGLVSSVASSWYGTGSPKFKAGTNFGSSRIDLPTDFSILEGRAQSGGTSFAGETNIIFKNDGTFDWQVFHKVGSPPSIVVDSSGNTDLDLTNGVIATENGKDIHIKGTLNGQVTVISDSNIWIDDDILYNQDPLTDPTADDLLGLIATKDIIVTDNAANRSNCTIDATLMALNKSFKVQNYDTGSPRGTLTVLGGMVQKERGPVGTMSGGVIKTGYLKKYLYDQRFMTKAPPYYPIFSRNSIVSWYE